MIAHTATSSCEQVAHPELGGHTRALTGGPHLMREPGTSLAAQGRLAVMQRELETSQPTHRGRRLPPGLPPCAPLPARTDDGWTATVRY